MTAPVAAKLVYQRYRLLIKTDSVEAGRLIRPDELPDGCSWPDRASASMVARQLRRVGWIVRVYDTVTEEWAK